MRRLLLWMLRSELAKRRQIRRELLEWAKGCGIHGQYGQSYFGRCWIRSVSFSR